MNLCDQNEIRRVLTRHGFHFSKSKGQNFLVDDSVPEKIVSSAEVDAGCGVLEIGPGIGALTAALSQKAGKVTAVELDRGLLPVLRETLSSRGNVELISGDILKTDLRMLVKRSFPGLKPVVCANLPYNITSPVLLALIKSYCFQRITVMVQREVALRMCSPAGRADYGAFSVFVQYHAEPTLLFDVPPSCFFPRPKVTSSVISLKTRGDPAAPVEDEALFFQVVRAAFAQRRKTLLNALFAVFGSRLSKDTLRGILESCGFPADIRGERLDIPAFAALSRRIGAALAP
ncbi:MAG: 16S rRNA (adenine(1518)-N(6)/adenine(1519)-N(6))-dimethyltransferase RsmA [Oscillospiraceae bacterium]|nr:16S rRNA (adenine(1518)-N(6)/adenine(1519)-N(6))-dimethyltransferase RsmA [Oscillospiraceae bacterium]